MESLDYRLYGITAAISSLTLTVTKVIRKSTLRFVNYYSYGICNRTFDSIKELMSFPRDSRFEAVIPS